MEQLKSLIESSSGLGAFDALLKTLADALNVSVQQIQQNLPMYLEQYARYEFIGNLGGIIFFASLTGIFVALFVATGVISLAEIFEIDDTVMVVSTIVIAFLSFVITLSVPIILEILKLNTSPVIYGAKELIKLLK